MAATAKDIEALAEWFATTNCRLNPNQKPVPPEVLAARQDVYRAIAKAMLENPPPVLRKAVRRLEG